MTMDSDPNPRSIDQPILSWSFFLSQGDGSLQRSLYAYVHKRFPEITLDESQIKDQAHQSYQMENSINSKFGYHSSQPANPNMFQMEAKYMSDDFKEDPSDTKALPHTLEEVMVGMIRRDYDYREGRIRKPAENEKYSFLQDPHLSHFSYFVLGRNPIGVPVFDQMLEDLRKLIDEHQPWVKSVLTKNPSTMEQLTEVVQSYNQTHPDQPVQIPDYIKS